MLILTLEMELTSIYWSPFGIFHPQTTEIQALIFDWFLVKTLRFQQYEIIILDVSVDLFGVSNSFAIPVQNFIMI